MISSTFLSIFISIHELYIEYKIENKKIDQQLEIINDNFVVIINHSLWFMLEDMVNGYISAIVDFPNFSYAEIVTPGNHKNYFAGKKLESEFKDYKIELNHESINGKVHNLGYLYLQTDNNEVFNVLVHRAFAILFTEFIKTTFLSLLIIFFVNNLVTRHLIDIVNFILNSNKFNKKSVTQGCLVLNRAAKNDELQFLVDTLNANRQENLNYLKSLESKEKVLENEVQKRALAENRISKQYDLITTMISIFDIFVVAVDKQHRVIMISNEVVKILGSKRADIVGKKIDEIVEFNNFSEIGIRHFPDDFFIVDESKILQTANCRFSAQNKWFPAKVISTPFILENNEVGFGLMIHDLSTEQQLDEANYLANHDYMTGLYNRFAMEKRFTAIINNENKQDVYCVALIDVDNFKDINDNFGHHAGDNVIKYIGRCLSGNIDKNDYAVRLGGDEFAVFFQKNLFDARSACKKIMQCIQSVKVEDVHHELMLSISVGLTLIRPEKDTLTSMFSRLDSACYQSKSIGGGTIRVAEENKSYAD
ncbi:MAG: diguanylate cyclase [Thiolinea sp.]